MLDWQAGARLLAHGISQAGRLLPASGIRSRRLKALALGLWLMTLTFVCLAETLAGR